MFIRHKKFKVNTKMEMEVVFKANHVVVTNADQRDLIPTLEQKKKFKAFWKAYEQNPFAGRDQIVNSFCFEICEMYPVKLGLLIALIGGMKKGNDMRGLSHVLLVGDPGTGKSQMLQYCEKLIPRSVYTTGAGSSVAGLTVGAVKSGDTWDLHPGALVLADSGVCCIDEFSLLDKRESASIHEAMEQQTISVAKAGIICKIKTSCTVFAACNPKTMEKKNDNTYDVDIGMSSPLLSRFDLVMLLADEHNQEFDEKLCDFILGLSQSITTGTPQWDIADLRAYIGYVKKFQVTMDEEVYDLLTTYFNRQRKMQDERKVQVTPRMLQSLARLSEGHAKLMCRRQVIISDAVMAIILMEYSLYSTNLIRTQTNSVTHVAFPSDPFEFYTHNAKIILDSLGQNEMWIKESRWLSSLSKDVDIRSLNASIESIAISQTPHHEIIQSNEIVSQEQYEWFRGDSMGKENIVSSSFGLSNTEIPASTPVENINTNMSGFEPSTSKRHKIN